MTFTPEQKQYLIENSVKIKDNNKYIEIMSYYSNYFKKTKINSIKMYIEFIFILLVILFLVCRSVIPACQSTTEVIFKGLLIIIGTILVYMAGKFVLDYIDNLPVVKRIQNKELDLVCFTGDLNDVSKFINYGASSSALQNYFMTVSGTKYQIDRNTYKILEKHKGKVVKIYFFPELLQRQVLISDATIILIEE